MRLLASQRVELAAGITGTRETVDVMASRLNVSVPVEIERRPYGCSSLRVKALGWLKGGINPLACLFLDKKQSNKTERLKR